MNGVIPVRDASGRVVALAGVDVDAAHVRTLLRQRLSQAAWFGGGTVIVWLIVGYLIARTIVRPITSALGRFGVLVGWPKATFRWNNYR